MPYPALTKEDHYMRADAVHDELVRRTTSLPNVYVHDTFGIDGNSNHLTGIDTAGIDVPGLIKQSLRAKIDDSTISTIIVPIHVPGVTEAGNHWVFYVLLRNSAGKMQAVYINPPGDGYCGRHGIELALQLVQEGLPAMLNSTQAGRIVTSPYPNHTSFANDVTTLKAMGVEFLSLAQLQQAKTTGSVAAALLGKSTGSTASTKAIPARSPRSAAHKARQDAGLTSSCKQA